MNEVVSRASAEYEAIAPLLADDFSDPQDDLDAVRAKFGEVHGHDPGPGVVVEAARSGHGVWVRPEDGVPRGTVFFVHGGGFVTSDASSYAFYGAALARATGWQVYIADYPLAPESVFPSQLDALGRAFAADVAGIDGAVVLMGDSCGGGMAVAFAMRESPVRDRAVGIVTLCGWFDLLAEGESATQPIGRDPFLDPAWLRRRGRDYVGPDGDPARPEASVLRADDRDLAALPPMLLHAGQVDRCRSDAEMLGERAAAVGVPVELRIWPAMPHGFHGMAGLIPEADAALREVREWLERRLVST